MHVGNNLTLLIFPPEIFFNPQTQYTIHLTTLLYFSIIHLVFNSLANNRGSI